MAEQQVYEGGCLCGALRYRATTDPLFVGHCHCQRCRKHTGAAFATFVGFPAESFTWTKGQPALYQSSELAQRGFCSECGSTISFHRPHKDEISILAGSLDHPDDVTPDHHIMTESKVGWVKLDDGLTCYSRFPPAAEDRDLGL